VVPPAPRAPTEAAKELVFSYAGIQKASLIVSICFVVLGCPMSTLFAWGLPGDLALRFSTRPVKATVTDARIDTSVEVNGINPAVVSYRWEEAGKTYEGKTTFTDREPRDFPEGAVVDAEVVPGQPEWSRLKGGTYATFGLIGMFTLIFPLAGLGLLFATVRANRRESRAFTHGIPGQGEVKLSSEDLTTSINERHPWKVAWEFDLDGQKYTGSLSHMTHALLNHFKVGSPVTVLYLRDDPKVNTLWVE
jgi:hypothetical protein